MNPTVTSPDQRSLMRAVNQQRDPQTYAVIGAAMAVHKELGSGFLERVYQEALVLELLCFPDDTPVLVERKACERLTQAHRAQVIHYMKATQIQRALLMNFGGSALQFERMVLGWDG